MRRSLALALLLSFALAGAASAATAPETVPFLLPKASCQKALTAMAQVAPPTGLELRGSLFAPRPKSRQLPLCPGPYSCPSTCTAGGICNYGPIGPTPTDCCTLPGGGEFCCDQDEDEVWALVCACEGAAGCEESQEVTLYCI